MNPFTVMLAAAVLTGAASSLSAQVLTGRVLESGSDQPIAAASISLLAGGRTILITESDSAGHFEMPVPGPGTYGLRVERLGYGAADTEALSFAAGEFVELAIRLGVTAVRLDPIMVIERRITRIESEFERRMETGRRMGLGVFVTRQELERNALLSVTDVLARVPLMSVQFDGRGNAWPATVSRGGCIPTLYLNGARMTFASGESVDDVIMPDMLEGIEVYRNETELPRSFAGIGQCGAVVFWTRGGDPGRRGGWRFLAGIGAVLGMVVLFVTN
jgi:hypothetical protein